MLAFDFQLSDNTATTAHEGKGGSAWVTLQTEVKRKDESGRQRKPGTVLFRELELGVLSSPHSERGERLRLIAIAMITFGGRRKSRRESIKRETAF